jgi:hypothetical protein
VYLRWGNYTHAQNECSVVISRTVQRGSDGQPLTLIERWDVQGQIHADSQALLTAAIKSLEAVYETGGKDLSLLTDSNGTTAHRLTSADSINGTQVIQQPSYPVGRGAEYTTFRNYTLAVEASYAINDDPILEFQEAVSISGTGGPRWGYLLPISGAPIAQQFTTASIVTAQQSGFAVGDGVYVSPPSPIWPNFEILETRSISREFPRKGSRERVTRWSYTFNAPSAIWGIPNEK